MLSCPHHCSGPTHAFLPPIHISWASHMRPWSSGPPMHSSHTSQPPPTCPGLLPRIPASSHTSWSPPMCLPHPHASQPTTTLSHPQHTSSPTSTLPTPSHAFLPPTHTWYTPPTLYVLSTMLTHPHSTAPTLPMFHLPCTCHCHCLSSHPLDLSSHPMGDISHQPHQRGPEHMGTVQGHGHRPRVGCGGQSECMGLWACTVRARTHRAGMWSCGARDGRHRSPTQLMMRCPGRSSFMLERGGTAAPGSPWGKWWVEEWGRCETYACSSILSHQAAWATCVNVDVNMEDGWARHEEWVGRGCLGTVLDLHYLTVGTYSRFIQGGPNLPDFPLVRGVDALFSYL